MVELIHKRKWDSKTFNTGRTKLDPVTKKVSPIFATKLQNGLHDIEPDGSFIDCDMAIEAIVNGVTTHQVKRGRYGELRFGDNSSENKHLCKIKYKDGSGISLKYLGADSGSPIINGDVKFAAADGIQLRHIPTYKGVKIELITNDPLTAPLEYAFSVKTYGQNYTYEIINGSIIATGEDGKIITIHAPYAVDANDDTGQVYYELLGIVDEYQLFKKVIDETWLRQAAAPVRIDPDVTIEDGVDGGVIKDARLNSAAVDENYGANADVRVSTVWHGMVKVDLSSYSGITVTSAYFEVDMILSTVENTITWYGVLRDWNEGTGSFSPANAGEVTWNSARHSQQAWTIAGCNGSGTDREAIADGSKLSANNANYQFPISSALTQSWIGVSSNGITLHGSTTAQAIWDSSEGATKPIFYIEYTEGNGQKLGGIFGLGRMGAR